MIDLLKRPEGATVEQIAAATGWQHHTIRGAISGALKKKLGLTVEATRTREVGPNKTGAKGSSHRLPHHRVEAGAGSPPAAIDRRAADMSGLLKQPGYRLHRPTAPRPRPCSPSRASPAADLDRALAASSGPRASAVRTIVGINEDGVFGSTREGWRPDLPDACKEPFVPLLWLKVHELLGRVPEGSTARFLQDGTLPD